MSYCIDVLLKDSSCAMNFPPVLLYRERQRLFLTSWEIFWRSNQKFMKKCLLVGIALLCLQAVCYASKGVVVKVKGDKAIISYDLGYLLVEWYGGHSPDKDDIYVGNFNEYGMKELYCTTSDDESKFWIDQFMADKEEALKFLYGDN